MILCTIGFNRLNKIVKKLTIFENCKNAFMNANIKY